ncbi:hypothetical protein [Snodgrassella communis]|jgi:3-oxoacyl-[acyl-carrier-protein] synthase III|uniref:hypothetical protein n=1 Tax=Snodgrassella communis TaxID=2946699 RepID=UPI000CA688E1|nr:hypothetical protein [Snodgrassella communis]PIT07651.1 hypothetical protein BGI31_08810 [Snodgrassella communis]PIT24782.1 hypothetical protein BGI35_00200 [Snodgrassella communis]
MTAQNSGRVAMPLKILSTGAAVPAKCMTSSELDRRFNKPDGYVQRQISDLPQHIASFDINNSCIGLMTALEMAACLLNQGVYRRIAIVAADLASRGLNWDDEESALTGRGVICG